MTGQLPQVLRHPRRTTGKIWLVRWTDHLGRRHRKSFYTENKARAYALVLEKEVETDGTRALALPFTLRQQALEGAERLAQHGKTLRDAVDHYVRYLEQNQRSCTVSELIELYLMDKKDDGISDRHLKSTEYHLRRFERTFGKRIVATLTFDEIKSWLHGMDVKVVTKHGYRRCLHAVFHYAFKRKFASGNPIDDIDLPKPPEEPIDIFTPEEMTRLLNAADPQMLPFLAIGAFAGIRSAEIARLPWANVRLDDPEPTIIIDAKMAKTGRRRCITISPNLKAWLETIPRLSEMIVSVNYKTRFYSLLRATCKKAGVPWKHNVLRHSFGTYFAATKKNLSEVSLEMGNTTGVLLNHYRNAVHPAQARAFWNIYPASQPIELPKAA